MKTMSPLERNVLLFMASTGGRWTRALAGVALIVTGVLLSGWWLVLVIPGGFMIGTGVMNYCPAGLALTGSGKSEDILANIAKVDALGSQVHKH